MKYIVEELVGNFSVEVGRFDNEEEAQDFVLKQIQNNCEDDSEKEFENQASYFNIRKEEQK